MTEEKVWTFIDREGWPKGEWDAEPDKVEWRDRFTDYTCIVRRGLSGSWCGYVAVPPGHPLHGVGYSACSQGGCEVDWCDHRPESFLEVHGGLTYAEGCVHRPDGTGVCHVPEVGGEDDLWWFGFDCAHSDDLAPRLEQVLSDAKERYYLEHGEKLCDWPVEYRNVAYVRDQCGLLAKQLLALARSE